MKAYIITTGIIFALLAAGHVARAIAEGTHSLGEPIFVLTTLISVGMVVWASLLFKKLMAR